MDQASCITLFTPYFAARTPERQAELDLCLRRNLDCASLARVVLLVDDGHEPPVQDPRLDIVEIPRRPTYRDWIDLSLKHAGGGVSILANSDIYFDASVRALHQSLAAPRAFVALSRYEKSGDVLVPHPNPSWSQDVWAVRNAAELPPGLLKSLDIPLGVPRCDNKIAYLFAVSGWDVHNPMHSVRSVHVHETQQRHYDKKADLTVIGAVAYVHPAPDAATPSLIDIDVWAVNTPAIRSVRLNRSLDAWAAESNAPPTAANVDAAVVGPAPVPVATTRPARAGLQPEPTARAPAEPQAATALPALSPAPGPDWLRFVTQGQCVHEALGRFAVYHLGGEVLALDWLNPQGSQVVPRRSLEAGEGPGGWAFEALLGLFVPPVLDVAPIDVRDRPLSRDDLQFWQYPAATERQARDNHRAIASGAHIDRLPRVVHTYLGLPWATYIDKKRFPQEVIDRLQPRLRGLRRLAATGGYELRVHTVCQQIHWERLLEQYAAVGVTDLHLSHHETRLLDRGTRWPMRLHSWPLIAPNVEDPARAEGLVVAKPLPDKRYLASFIGAHMPHYRSDIRVKLFEAARASGRSDVMMDLGHEWHFNKVVYQEQVQHKALSADERQHHESATRRYNELLSDSVFSLCPEGAGPNTLRLWESLAVGAIPVVLADGWIPPPAERDQPDLRQCCVFHPMAEVATLFDTLLAIPETHRAEMQRQSIEAYARIRRRTAFGGLPRPATQESSKP